MRTLTLALSVSVATIPALVGCRGQTTTDPPFVGIRNMYHQPKYEMQQGSDYFEDGRAMRMPVTGAVARESETDTRIATGRLEDNSGYVLVAPPEVIQRGGGMDAMLSRGKDRFAIFCAPCHGLTGAGDGMVVKRNAGMPLPPTYHQDRIRHMPDGQLYATIENGVRNMPAYGPVLSINDRWAITQYIRALELSQADAPSTEKKP